MLVPFAWLKEYTGISAGIDEFCERMIMSGSNIEGVKPYGEGLEKVVIGKVLSVNKHEDSDHLVVGMVDVGDGAPIQIVTGAQNVTAGAYVPTALVGSVLPGGLKIKKGRLRGVDSFGMMCSAQELGFDDKAVPTAYKDGIWLLEGEYTPGADFVEAVGLRDDVIDFEITPNRPDCLSIIGMAREAAAVFGSGLRLPAADAGAAGAAGAAGTAGAAGAASGDARGAALGGAQGAMQGAGPSGPGGAAAGPGGGVSVVVEDGRLCRRYIARLVTDVNIAQSPWWMQKRLMLAGMRPINNIVDITNYVLLEYGQPLHAFDVRMVEGGRIVVGLAEEGQRFITLDGAERVLQGDMLMIKDAVKPIGIAGVMGGLNSEIKGDTSAILIESACFDSDSVRLTSKKLALRTEASSRFEKGISPGLAKEAADRACGLAALLGAGTLAGGSADIYAEEAAQAPIKIRVPRVNSVLGADLTGAEIKSYLERLEMKVSGGGDAMEAVPHHTRLDLKEEVDLIEEVARMHGYDRLEPTLPGGGAAAAKPYARALCDTVRDAMTGMGYNELQTYSFVSPKGVDEARIPEEGGAHDFVKLINPLGEENSVMRTVLMPNLLEVVGRNYSRNIERAWVFEAGNTFRAASPGAGPTQAAGAAQAGSGTAGGAQAAGATPGIAAAQAAGATQGADLPQETLSLAIGMYGGGAGFFTLKGTIEELLRKLGLEAAYRAEAGVATYHPGRCAGIYLGETRVGVFGELHPEVADKYGIGTRCCAGEIDLESVIARANVDRYYRPLPKYPAIGRDMALVVDEGVTVGELEAVIRSCGGRILESVKMFDVYRGKQIGEGKKSVAFNLVYRSPERTLTDEEAASEHNRALAALSERLGAALRDS